MTILYVGAKVLAQQTTAPTAEQEWTVNDIASQMFFCTRQRAGPLVKECRSLRPRFSSADTAADRKAKNEIIRCAHSAVCRTQADRLELRLALFEYDGVHYTLTFDNANLPKTFANVRKTLRAFMARASRWRKGAPFDWIYCIEGKHGDHRYHIHMILRDEDFPPAVVRFLWKAGEVDDEPVLRKEGGYRRLAEYLNKESPDGFIIPIGRHPWSCSRSLSQKLPPAERWQEDSGVIDIPDAIIWARRGERTNDFGSHYYGSYIQEKKSYLQSRAHTRAVPS